MSLPQLVAQHVEPAEEARTCQRGAFRSLNAVGNEGDGTEGDLKLLDTDTLVAMSSCPTSYQRPRPAQRQPDR